MGVRVFQTRILSVRAQTAQRLLLDHQFCRCKCARLLGWPSTGTAVDRAKASHQTTRNVRRCLPYLRLPTLFPTRLPHCQRQHLPIKHRRPTTAASRLSLLCVHYCISYMTARCRCPPPGVPSDQISHRTSDQDSICPRERRADMLPRARLSAAKMCSRDDERTAAVR